MTLTATMQQWTNGQQNPEVVVNENFVSLQHQAVYAMNPDTTSGLTWGYLGGRWSGFGITAGTLTLTASQTNYVVVEISTGTISTSTTTTNWDATSYLRVFKITTGSSTVSAVEDHRAGNRGVHGQYIPAAQAQAVAIPIAVGDETTALTTGTAKVTFRMPFAMTLTSVRASVTTAPTGSNLVVDINENTGSGATTILSTKLSIDASEKTSTTAATPAVISDSALADDSEITIDIDQIGSTIAGAGLKVYLIGTTP